MNEADKKSVDKATQLMIEKAAVDGCETIFDRAEAMKPCPIGAEGSCCKNCGMGPCRVPVPKKKEGTTEKTKRRGLCGATAETIAARNFARMVAAGAAAHSDHARGVAELFLATAKGEVPDYQIKDEQKLYQLAMDFGVEIGDRSVQDVAIDVGEKALAEFGRQEGEILFLKRAPLKRQQLWRETGTAPRGIDREIVEIMHRTHIGVDQDYQNILKASARCALADGWGGSMISTELQDAMFGNPVPIAGQINLGVLKRIMSMSSPTAMSRFFQKCWS
jgi:carbon-monoxide dehydrogenase catalytic subunit